LKRDLAGGNVDGDVGVLRRRGGPADRRVEDHVVVEAVRVDVGVEEHAQVRRREATHFRVARVVVGFELFTRQPHSRRKQHSS
jgi:hypothetical protein